MLPTFVIGLREGLEGSLIVGIILAFLHRSGRRDLARWALLGVGIAVALCTAIGVGLYAVARDLPQRQQEVLETVIGIVAIAMVTYMVVWMKRHSRDLKKQLEGVAGTALANGSAWALIGTAFLAVLREGFETAVFLLAAFNSTSNRGTALAGAVLGVAVAVALGYGIYRGGIRINLSKFFRVTGFVLVLVAAGLVQTAFRTAHEAGWVNFGQQSTVDLTAVIDPGSVQSALITGMLGIQPQPKLIEFVAWLLYFVPVGLYVAWPQGRGLARRTIASLVAATAVLTGLIAGATLLWAPASPEPDLAVTAAAVTSTGTAIGDTEIAVNGDQLRVTKVDPVTGDLDTVTTVSARRVDRATVSGITVTSLTASLPAVTTTQSLTFDQVAALNGGRLPLGVRGAGADPTGSVTTTTTEQVDVSVSVSVASQRIVAATWSAARTAVVQGATGEVTLPATSPATATLSDRDSTRLVAAAREGDDLTTDRRSDRSAAALLGTVAILMVVTAVVTALAGTRRRSTPAPVSDRPDSTATPSPSRPQDSNAAP